MDFIVLSVRLNKMIKLLETNNKVLENKLEHRLNDAIRLLAENNKLLEKKLDEIIKILKIN